MNNKKNNSKKKNIIFLLLFFAIVGLVGYGVYSYYWAKGDFSGSDDISITAYNPETIIDGNSSFLGSGGTISLSCPSDVSSNGYVTCTGSLDVTNNGSTKVQIEVLDENSGVYGEKGDIDLTPGTPSFNWSSVELNPGSTETLNVSVETYVDSDYGDSDSHETTSSFNGHDQYYGATGQIQVSFKLKATQVHD